MCGNWGNHIHNFGTQGKLIDKLHRTGRRILVTADQAYCNMLFHSENKRFKCSIWVKTPFSP